MFVAAVIVALSFFEAAGEGGKFFMKAFSFLLGRGVFALPLFFILAGFSIFGLKQKNKWPVILAIVLLTVGACGFFESMDPEQKEGGWLGYLVAWPFLKGFGLIASRIIFAALIVAGFVIFKQFISFPKPSFSPQLQKEGKPPAIKRIFGPKFKVRPVPGSYEPPAQKESPIPPPLEEKEQKMEFKPKPSESLVGKNYHFPPADLLESDKGIPTAGDIKINSAIIKRTLQNFSIPVEMSEVNIGPTVTQYTLKPAEGVKLTKITALSNDLALALASHPIRIEAPIPGRPLVGVEVPNKSRTLVRMKNLLENQNFQNSLSSLTLALGRNVASKPVFADLGKMPHLLVAGSTGTGKTICLNSLIVSLLYQNSPETLRFIMVDPKRVEFPVYNGLPHLLTPVIYDSQKCVNAFKWLIEEMERRFDVLSAAGARDISIYNQEIGKNGAKEPLPYIVLVVDELADLMAARGREIEGGIVRLAQMARAVGIHLILATQRPSVEVITGLIKANITSRITFQVASQVDSRTVLDVAGAERLLGAGDLLFLSAEMTKPKRTQGVYVSDKEVKKVVKHIKSENKQPPQESEITDSLEKTLENQNGFDFSDSGDDDPLYEEAKKTVIEAKKASASLLQRRLRVGYARAARLIDMLEEKNVIGPGEGAKPREVYGGPPQEEEDWKKI